MGFRYSHKASHATPGKLAEVVAEHAAKDKMLLLEALTTTIDDALDAPDQA